MSNSSWLLNSGVAAAVSLIAGHVFAVAPTFLTNPGIYTPTASSNFSDFSGQEVPSLFDANHESVWAIDGFLGNNPQGRDEGWISVVLNTTYQISHLRFAPRHPTGQTDSINRADIWVSELPFGVDVTSAASTNSFLTMAQGGSPNLTLGPFASSNQVDYPFAAPLPGKYLLARFVNTSDRNNDRNLGARTFQIGQLGVVPEPSTMLLTLAGAAAAALMHRRRYGRLQRRG